MINKSIRTILCLLSAILFSSCTTLGNSWKSLVGGGSDSSQSNKQVTTPKFSEQENLRVNDDKQYKRMNRQRFEDEADVKEGAGSLWVMEGQGAYLFSQNQIRMVGDLLNVKIEGAAKSQLQTKVKVISKLLDRLEAPRGLAAAGPATPAPAVGAPPAPGTPGAPAAPGADGQTPDAAQAAQPVAKSNEPPFSVQTVPTRIVEQMRDGSYRVRGMQPFMIGKREFKVIVTGVVRGEDFDDAGIDASKLLDPQFDIVSSRKGAAL
jgi:flagellar L-ring protein precursor FlgH